jgi:hypothetical protein
VANKTVVFNNQVYAGTAGLTLLLISPTDGSIGNGAGDTLTAGSNGLFSCIVTENITGWWHVVVKNGATAILEGGQVYFQSNTLGTYYVDGFFNAGSSTWDTPYASHKLASTFGKLMDLLRKANMAVEATVLASPIPTTTTFNVSGLNYPTGAFEHAVLFFADDSSLAEQNSPILTFVNNGNGTQTIVLEEARTAAPVAGDTVLIDATSHVHAIADIQAGIPQAVETQLQDDFSEILDAVENIQVDNQAIAEAVEAQLQDDFAAINLDEESVAILVYEKLVNSSVARSSLPVVSTGIDAIKYADFNLDIQVGTSATSTLVVSIGCENHTYPNIEVSSDSGLIRLNNQATFDSNWGSVTRESPTQVAFRLSVNALKLLSAGEYLLELRELTDDDEVLSKKEYSMFLRSGVGRIIE